MGMRVLHVEDDLDIQEIAKLSLETIGGFEILQCSSGKQALKLVEAFNPDLFLFDVQMPEMSGETLYQEIRQLPGLENIPTIFMTARAQEKDVTALKKLGALDVVTKPFDPMALPEQIKEILARETG